MTEQQQHLETAIQQLNVIGNELNNLNNSMLIKKEQAIKLQGIIEYLNSIGVTLPENLEEPSEEIEVSSNLNE